VTTGPVVLAIDAGQTGIKTRVQGDGPTREDVFPGIRTHAPLLPQLAQVARAVLERTHAPVSTVTAGVSGLTSAEADAGALRSLLAGTGVTRTVLSHDSTTAFLGALGDARGAVVAAGTGVVTLAVGASTMARVDGWGYLIGDAGSGYWIGREALDAVMRDYDGRGPATTLRSAAEERWPVLSEAYIDLQSRDDRVAVIASLAAVVAAHAGAGDPAAEAITARAAGELARSVTTALRRADLADDRALAVCTVGGVFRSAALRAAFAADIAASGLDIDLVAPAGQGLDGAVALATLAPEHPLAASVSVSG